MKKAAVPPEEIKRVKDLIRYEILDTDSEKDFDELVQLASQLCKAPISLISLVDEHTQWFKVNVGHDTKETKRDFAFCAHAIHQDEMLVISDVTKDERFCNNPLLLKDPNIRFYAGIPLISPKGHKLGALCVVDRVPRKLTDEQLFGLRILAKQVVKQMEMRLSVIEQKKLNDINNTLLSILSHDLKSPINSLSSLLELTEKGNLSAQEMVMLLTKIKEAFTPAKMLMDNLLHWATSQFNSSGLKIEPVPIKTLVEDEIRYSALLIEAKNNTVQNNISKDTLVLGDYHSLHFVIRNLLLNANKFTQNGIISISAEQKNGKTQVSITDSGQGIQKNKVNQIFNWGARARSEGTKGEKGSGIGLKICKDLIEKHGGEIWVESEPMKGSTFHFVVAAYN